MPDAKNQVTVDDVVLDVSKRTLTKPGAQAYQLFIEEVRKKVWPLPDDNELRWLLKEVCPLDIFDQDGRLVGQVLDGYPDNGDIQMVMHLEGDNRDFEFNHEFRGVMFLKALRLFYEGKLDKVFRGIAEGHSSGGGLN